MNVEQLIEHLKTYPPDMIVIAPLYSEYKLLEIGDIGIHEACEPREDGWVHRRREDKPTVKYLEIGF